MTPRAFIAAQPSRSPQGERRPAAFSVALFFPWRSIAEIFF